jgi:hypothetical protein
MSIFQNFALGDIGHISALAGSVLAALLVIASIV